jgi:arsenate reductase (thioredoxin)
MRKQKVLFLCTQNSARSQMAEGFLRHLAGDRFEVYSAGYEVGDEIHPYATEVMEEVGIDISDQYPKGLKTYMGRMGFNYSIIVCARA